MDNRAQYQAKQDVIMNNQIRKAMNIETHLIFSKTFEKTFYNTAKKYLNTNPLLSLPEIDHLTSGNIKISFIKLNSIQYLTINYDGVEQNSLQILADFYNNLCPEIQAKVEPKVDASPAYLLFLQIPFIEKILPMIGLSYNAPSKTNLYNIKYIHLDNKLFCSSRKVNHGEGLYIAFGDKLLGDWKYAYRLNYDVTKQQWTCNLPEEILKAKNNEFKLLIGPYDYQQPNFTVEINSENKQLKWDEGDNQVFILQKSVEKELIDGEKEIIQLSKARC